MFIYKQPVDPDDGGGKKKKHMFEILVFGPALIQLIA